MRRRSEDSNFIRFGRDANVVNPLRVRPEVVRELEYRLLLCYMGQTRQSARIIERQTRNYREGRTATVQALHRLKGQTLEMKKALLLGDVDAMGELLHEAWESKKRLEQDISNEHVDRLYRLARREGAIGGKMPGAGGGGYFLLLTRFDRKHRVAAALESTAPRPCRSSSSPAASRPGPPRHRRGRAAVRGDVRIALVGPVHPWRGGIAQYLGMLGEALSARAEVRAVTFTRQYPEWLFPGKSQRDESAPRPRFPVTPAIDTIDPSRGGAPRVSSSRSRPGWCCSSGGCRTSAQRSRPA